jgi:hypothetical protein
VTAGGRKVTLDPAPVEGGTVTLVKPRSRGWTCPKGNLGPLPRAIFVPPQEQGFRPHLHRWGQGEEAALYAEALER